MDKINFFAPISPLRFPGSFFITMIRPFGMALPLREWMRQNQYDSTDFLLEVLHNGKSPQNPTTGAADSLLRRFSLPIETWMPRATPPYFHGKTSGLPAHIVSRFQWDFTFFASNRIKNRPAPWVQGGSENGISQMIWLYASGSKGDSGRFSPCFSR